ncbi:MAG: glycosyltransferase [Lachnospiraceae bacterium]|nr:glycosyltransferase [Lachnospiraceae bacterium]
MNKISIATTTFNDEKTIIPVLEQLLHQTMIPDEIVIADGGSKDRTVEVVENYAKNSAVRIRIISDGKRRNIPKGFNDAIKATCNDWVLVMGTGNSYYDDFIEKMIDTMNQTDALVFYSTIIGSETTKFAHWFNQYFLRGNRVQDLDISNHGMLIHKSVFDQVGYFWEGFVYAGEDLEFSRRIRKKREKAVWVEKAVAYWDTPQNWKDYQKKMKVNAIADWQMEDSQIIWKRCIIQLCVLLLYTIVSIWQPCTLLLLIPVMVATGYKKKTTSIPAIVLGLYNRYLMIWYYVKNRKYAASEHHLPIKYQ